MVAAAIRAKGTTVSISLTDRFTNQPLTSIVKLSSSSLSINGNLIRITVPLSMLPSSGKAFNQWNVNFFTQNPAQKNNFHSIASLTPEFTQFQVGVTPPSS